MNLISFDLGLVEFETRCPDFRSFGDDKIIQIYAVPTVPASEAAVELQTLIFEARSAKDSAW